MLKKIKSFFVSSYAKNILNSRKNLIVVTKNNETKDVNRAFLDFFGFSSLKDFKKKHKCICELFVKENGYLYGENWIDELLNNPQKQYKIKIKKNNKEYIFKVEAVQFNNKVIITLTDITQLIKQEEEFKEVNELLKQYKKAVDELLIVSKTDPKGIITYVNKNFCYISGYSKDELIGKPHNIVRHPDMPKEAFKDMWDTIKRGEIWRGFIKNRKKDGGFYWVDSGIMPIKNSKGEIVEYIALRTDITFLIEARRKAQEAEKAKGMFLANMSHEIRTPLNAILGFTQLLEKKENLDKDVQKYIRIINSSANTLLKVINDILDISKIEAGDISIEEIEFNPNKVFNDIAALFLGKTKEKEIDYEIDIDKLPECIKSDEHRLKQVLANLIGNAVKFTPQKGKIVLSIKILKEDNEKVTLKFSVKDNGIGIPKDKQKDIFKAFSQADGSVIRKFGGTGLGLTISSKIVQKLGGEIEVDSEEGKGSEFYFTLEFKKCAGIKNSESKENKNISYKAKILVAEDDAFNQELIKEILNEWNIDFTIVSNGKEAVEKVKNNKYDFIFLDINMPEMNGVEAVKNIKKLTDVPVIAMTANAFREDIKSYFEAGFDDYVSKPIKLKELEKVFDKYAKKDFKKESYISSIQENLKLNKDILNRLIKVYLSTVKEDLNNMEQAIKEEDFEKIRQYSHKIKGSSLNLRIEEIAKLAEEMEEASKKEVKIFYKDKLEEIRKIISEMEKENENNSI